MIAEHLLSLLPHFDKARVLVVGDVYLDEVSLGRMTGVSLEAPVPIFEIDERRHNPGAAGNAACNLAALGARTSIVGVVGADPHSDVLREEFRKRGIEADGLVVDADRPTNVYGKLKAQGGSGPGQEVLRTDTPTPGFITGDVETQVVINIAERSPDVDAIVVVDQIGSVVTALVLEEVIACANKHELLTVGDSRGRIGAFKGFGLVTPNEHELSLAMDLEVTDDASLRLAADELLRVCKRVLITRGAKGMTGFNIDGSFDSPSLATDVVDVTGAGDSVTAAATLTLLAGGSIRDAALAGSAAAAAAVAQPGAVAVSRRELEAQLPTNDLPPTSIPLEELRDTVAALKAQGKTVVWTNGCFDIIHAGHVTYLAQARREGDVLVVGLNSDDSVRAVKGPGRPIVPEAERALILSALACVDYVTVFAEDDVTPMLEALEPDVYAKGGDYTLETINQDERRLVEGYGGRIALIPGVKDRSTTNLVERLSEEYGE